MKIVQSFWSKPLIAQESLSGSLHARSGWPHRVLNYYSWVLSCLELRKYYDDVELVTDDAGKELLIDKLNLPYTSVNTALNDISDFHPGLIFLGKVYAYSLQSTPFLHIDGDLFMTKKLDETIVNAPILAQSPERCNDEKYLNILKRLGKIPDCFKGVFERQSLRTLNAGFIGGNDISFFQHFVKESFAFLEGNMDYIKKALDSDPTFRLFNLVYEQLLISQLADYCGQTISYLFPDILTYYDPDRGIGYFHAAEENNGYIHCLAQFKVLRLTHSNIERRLRDKYPEYYNRINHLVNHSEI